MTEITVTAKDGGSFSAYIALPAQTPAPAIILIQEIFGVNAEMREKCDEYAAQGYIALCPDLFWRMEPGVQLTDKTEAEWQKAFGFFQKFDVDLGVADLDATLDAVKSHAACNGTAGAVGYCLGGKLAFLMAARTPVDATVSYYGVGLDALLGEAGGIARPLLMHIAEKDEYVPPAAQETIKTALKNHPQVTIYSYPNADHAFARGNGIHYKADAALQANERTRLFFTKHLKDAA